MSEWESTGRTRPHWGQGGAVSLEGEQRNKLTGATRWRRARWLPLDEYHSVLREHLASFTTRKEKA